MNERPMRQMSLRAFRDQIADLHTPVEVSKRDGQGNILVLGYWTPYAQYAPDSKPIESPEPGERPTATISVRSAEGETVVPPQTFEIPIDGAFPVGSDDEFDRHPRTAPRVIKTPEEAAAATRAAIASVDRPIHPVPKPSQRRKR